MTPVTWNADQEVISATKHRNTFSVGWRNFRKDTIWQPINTDIQQDRTVTAFPGSVQYPVSSQGDCVISFDGEFSMKRYVEEKNGNNPEPALEMVLSVPTQHNVTGNIEGNWMVYPNAWDGADLMYGVELGRSAKVKKIVRINSMPSGTGDVQYTFRIQSPDGKVFGGPQFNQRPWAGKSGDKSDVTSRVFIAKGDSTLRGALLAPAKCWWFENGVKVERSISMSFTVQPRKDTVVGTKTIPRAYITQALAAGSPLYVDATFTPDADPETYSVDGWVKRTTAGTWAEITAGAGTAAGDFNSSPYIWFSSSPTTDQFDTNQRVFMFYDTSSLDGTGFVSAATQHITGGNLGISDTGGWASDYNMVTSSSSSTSALALSDYQTAGTTLLSDTGIAHSAMALDVERSLVLNSAGRAAINLTGLTRFCLGAATYDFGKGTPTWVSNKDQYASIYQAEVAGTTKDPRLDVTMQAGPSIPILAHHYRQQLGVN
jgi:hypothetical protein